MEYDKEPNRRGGEPQSQNTQTFRTDTSIQSLSYKITKTRRVVLTCRANFTCCITHKYMC